MSRNRKKDYYCEIKECNEAFWVKPGHSSTSYRYYHLRLALNGNYRSSGEVVDSLKVLEPYFGKIPHYTDYLTRQVALERANPEELDKLMVFNSRTIHKSSGWEVDLWCFRELLDWDILKDIKLG